MTKRKPRMTAAERHLKEQRDHELKLSLLDAFKRDPDLKYYVGVAATAGVATLAGLFAVANEPALSPGFGEPVKPAPTLVPDWAFLISPGLLASPSALPNWMKWSSGAGESPADLVALAGGVVGMMGMGFGAWCAGMLMLKTVFGEQGAASIVKSFAAIP